MFRTPLYALEGTSIVIDIVNVEPGLKPYGKVGLIDATENPGLLTYTWFILWLSNVAELVKVIEYTYWVPALVINPPKELEVGPIYPLDIPLYWMLKSTAVTVTCGGVGDGDVEDVEEEFKAVIAIAAIITTITTTTTAIIVYSTFFFIFFSTPYLTYRCSYDYITI